MVSGTCRSGPAAQFGQDSRGPGSYRSSARQIVEQLAHCLRGVATTLLFTSWARFGNVFDHPSNRWQQPSCRDAFPNLEQEFYSLYEDLNGSPLRISATGGASGNPVIFTAAGSCTVSGATVHITGAGFCTITANQAGNSNYNSAASVPQKFNIFKATATITLSGLNKVYNGSANAVTASTNPAGLTVDITYAGASEVPVDAGSYAVLATINDDNYQGTQTGTLVIAQAAQ